MWQNIEFSPEQDAAIDACSMGRARVRARHEVREPAWWVSTE